MDKVFIKDLLARGVIGVYTWERQQPQDILINIVVEGDLGEAGQTDDLVRSIDYDSLAQKVLAHVGSSRRFTVEALASDIANICLADPRAIGVQVRVEKPGAVRFANSVGVEIYRSR